MPYQFDDGQVYTVAKAVVKGHKQDASGNLDPIRIYEARQVVWSIRAVVQCGLADGLAHLRLPPLPEDDGAAAPSPSPAVVVDAYDVDLAVEEDCDLPSMPPSGVVDVHSKLQADMDLINEECVKFSVEVPKNVASVFKLALRGLITLH